MPNRSHRKQITSDRGPAVRDKFLNTLNGFFILCLCVLIFSGCATLAENKRIEALDEAVNSYGTAIRWGYLDLAKRFIKSPEDGQKETMQDLSGIRITSYEIMGKKLSGNKLEAQQVVEIQYYHTNNLIEKKIIDTQLWKYDANDKKWYLHSRLPDLK